jgi:hypothetical protein
MATESLPALANCTNTLLGKLLAARTDLEDLQRKAFPNKTDHANMKTLMETVSSLELRLKRSMLQQVAALH